MGLREVARQISEIAASKGWDRVRWEDNFPGKLMLVITEVDEAARAADNGEVAYLAEEMADIAIRMLGMLNDLEVPWFPERIEGRHQLRAHVSPFRVFSELMWPVVSRLSGAMECWRNDSPGDAVQWVEMTLLHVYRVADILKIDLDSAIAQKMTLNLERPILHGKKRTLG